MAAKAAELGAVLKRGQDLLRHSHGDDTKLVEGKLAALESRYEGKLAAINYSIDL